MSAPDIPALRLISADRLQKGDVYWGMMPPYGPPVLELRTTDGLKVVATAQAGPRELQVDVEGESPLRLSPMTQVAIEHK